MPASFEYKNMSFEKRDGVWIHKDWALPGDFGDIFEKPASTDLAEKVELAYQIYCLERKLMQKDLPPPNLNKEVVKKTRKTDLENLDMTKTLEENGVKPIPPKVKKTTLMGSFNPFKDLSKP